MLFPIYVTIVNSLLAPDQLVHQPPPLFPTNPQWGHYATAWTSGSMSKYMATSADHDGDHRGRAAGDVDPRRLRLRLPALPVQAHALRRLPGHADDPARGDVHHESRHGHVVALVQQLRGPVHPVPRHGLRHLPHAPGVPADPPRPPGGGPARRLRPPALHDPGRRAARPPVAGRAGRVLLPRRVEPVPVAARLDRRVDAALHRAARAEAAPGHPGVADPGGAGRRRHRVRAAGDPAPDLPEAAGAQPHGRSRQVREAPASAGRVPRRRPRRGATERGMRTDRRSASASASPPPRCSSPRAPRPPRSPTAAVAAAGRRRRPSCPAATCRPWPSTRAP